MNLSERTQDHIDAEHPPLEQLKAFALDQLGDEDSAAIECHLAGCDRCVALLESVPP